MSRIESILIRFFSLPRSSRSALISHFLNRPIRLIAPIMLSFNNPIMLLLRRVHNIWRPFATQPRLNRTKIHQSVHKVVVRIFRILDMHTCIERVRFVEEGFAKITSDTSSGRM